MHGLNAEIGFHYDVLCMIAVWLYDALDSRPALKGLYVSFYTY